MKTIKFAGFLLYRYYANSRSKDIAYMKMLLILIVMAIFHIFQVLLIANKLDYFSIQESNILERWGKILLCITPLYIFFWLTVKEATLKQMKVDERKIKRGYRLLILYALVSFAFTFILAIMRNGWHSGQ